MFSGRESSAGRHYCLKKKFGEIKLRVCFVEIGGIFDLKQAVLTAVPEFTMFSP
jgi:hypothetical protein